MADEVEPLPVPSQDPGPDLVAYVGFYLLTEAAGNATKEDTSSRSNLVASSLLIVDAGRRRGVVSAEMRAVKTDFHETAEMVHTPDVQVGEVSAIRLMDIVICFEERGMGGGNEWLEQNTWGM